MEATSSSSPNKEKVSESTGEPSLYEECLAMFEASIAMPATTNIRCLARQGKLSDQDACAVLELPTTFSNNIDVLVRNKEIMLKEYRHDSAVPFHVEAAEALQKEYQNQESSLSETSIIIFDDEHQTSELVYAIARNSAKKRIVLGFRGSVTLEDYKIDFDIVMGNVSNPLKDEPRQPDNVLVHNGFKHYLLDKRKGDSKFDVILEHLRSLLSEYPDHQLYITGHSLGGALATLAAFQLAPVQEIPKPITLITFGALTVGDLRFRRAFQAMERKKLIRALSVVTDGDLIPLIYRRGGYGFCRLFTCRSNIYRKVGNEVKIYPNKPCTIDYPPEASTGFGAFLKDIPHQTIQLFLLLDALCCRKSIAQNHSVYQYFGYLSRANDLEKISFDDLYTRRYGV